MNKEKENIIKLHSKAKDNTWFHFREDMNSLYNSFTISYLSDGTIVLSGDYGSLVWKRISFNEARNNRHDFGFPKITDNINYFEEKLCDYNIKQIIKCFNYELAWDQLEEHYLEYEEYTKEQLSKLKSENYFWGDEISEESFYRFLNDDLELYNPEIEFGIEYNKQFKFLFNKLQQVSEIILKDV